MDKWKKFCCRRLACCLHNVYFSGAVEWGFRGRLSSPPLNFSQSENAVLAGKFSSKNTKYGAENPPFWALQKNLGAKQF